jgi:hypothetical protein
MANYTPSVWRPRTATFLGLLVAVTGGCATAVRSGFDGDASTTGANGTPSGPGADAGNAIGALSGNGGSAGNAGSGSTTVPLLGIDAGPGAAVDACVKGSCTADNGALYCGRIGDGCGGAIDCGMACPDGGVCGGEGVPGVCPGTGAVCTGIQCNVATCSDAGAAGATTSVSGTVYDPAGVNPIYNALVYVPNAPLDPVPTGASCDTCGATASGQPITDALTDTAGHFTLTNVPSGANIPLVIQVGKWRRQVTIASVASCVDNPITDTNLTRLPRTQAEGNIPLIAVTTGNADAVECLLRRIGIDDSEFTTDQGTGRVHMYYGGDLTGPTGAGVGTNSFSAPAQPFSSAGTLWSSVPKMEGYDIMLLSCEGTQNAAAHQPYLPNMEAYLDAGGRVFFGHDHFFWLKSGSPALQGTADYIGNGAKLPQPIVGMVNTTFPKGAALADWLVNVGATPTRGQLSIQQGQFSVAAVNPPTQDWITVPMNPNDSAMRPSVQYMTFNTPVGSAADAQCGRAVFTDLHVNAAVGGAGGDNSDPTKPFPTECKDNGLTPQAKALEFIFFDLSACVQSDTLQPTPPPPPSPPLMSPPPPPR